MKTLFKRDSKGKVRSWSIRTGLKEGVHGIFTCDGILGGKIKDEVFKEAKEQNVGKSNYRNPEQQAEEMMKSAITKKLRSNYFNSPEEIKEEEILFMPTGCPSGMIWEQWKNKSHVVYPALGSPKLDGSKTYSTWRENRVYLNTRSAKEHLNFEHIREELKDFYKENKHIVLDGEAYNHEYSERFDDLQSIFKKQKPTDEQRQLSKEVSKFYIYDAVDLTRPELTAGGRQMLLKSIFERHFQNAQYLIHWPSVQLDSEEEYDEYHESCMDDGFEGTVLKIMDAPYVQRKNKFVMKRKPKFDCEFKIIDIIEGEGTNKGIAAKMLIDLTTAHGMNEEHKALLKESIQESGMGKGWNHAKLKNMLENKENYIGQYGTFEYGGITGKGRLRFPKFKSLRDLERD